MLGHALTGMLDMAVRHGIIKDNPARNVRLPIQERADVRAPSLDDLKLLFALLNKYGAQPPHRGDSIRDLSDIASMMLATGARIGETLALQWSDDFNLLEWTVAIQSTLVRGLEGKLERRAPKTRSSIRTLSLPEFVKPMLAKRHLESHVAWVFPSAAGKARWLENVRTQWKAALEGSEIAWMTPHDLRKAVATVLGTEQAKEQLGHATISVTDKHYVEKITKRPDLTHLLEQFGQLEQP